VKSDVTSTVASDHESYHLGYTTVATVVAINHTAAHVTIIDATGAIAIPAKIATHIIAQNFDPVLMFPHESSDISNNQFH